METPENTPDTPEEHTGGNSSEKPHEQQPSANEAAPQSNANEAHEIPDAEQRHDEALLKEARRKTRQSFFIFTVFAVIVTGIFFWIFMSPKHNETRAPLRSVLELNHKVNKQFFSEKHLAPEYPASAAVAQPKVNGDLGMDEDYDTSEWVLNVVNVDKHDTMHFSMNDIKKLPKTEICYNFKCIEGWSQVTRWAGVRFIDFIKYYKLGTHSGKPADENNLKDLAAWAGFETPDDEYYVGLDMASAMHPQTLLCYEMSGKPLPFDQGAPLRLIVPVKYGIKSLKRIGVIFFSDKRPHDYWFEQGYDYDAAL